MKANLELGVIGNGASSALIDEQGTIVWSCLPRFDSDPVFAALLSPREGRSSFAIEIVDGVPIAQSYLGHTAVLVTRFRDASGAEFEVRDFAPRFKQHDRMFHPAMLIRQIVPVRGVPSMRVHLNPGGARGGAASAVLGGSNHLRYVLNQFTLRVTTDAPLSALDGAFEIVLDRPVHFILGPDESLTRGIAEFVRDAMDRTLDYWHDWVRSLYVPFEWQDAVIRAAITLKLCQYEDTGAIVAALTTSIPEAPGTARNWDYRFCWLRDAAYVVRALNRLSATRTMESYLRYVLNVSQPQRRVQPVYGIGLETELTEIEVDALTGYNGDGPVRFGNLAYAQEQHDVHGSVVLALEQLFFDKRLQLVDPQHLFGRLERFGDAALEAFGKPDAGIWEFRGRLEPHTQSALMCWAAVDRLGRIAGQLGLVERQQYWAPLASKLREEMLARAWNPARNSFASNFGGERIDASLLLLGELHAVRYDDPRFLGTIAAIEAELRVGDTVYRYTDPDDFGRPDTSFTLCTFWFIHALERTGRADEARQMFDSVLSRRTRLGLLSEDLNSHTGELWGNFPQTYPLVGLINCAMRLSRRWEDFL